MDIEYTVVRSVRKSISISVKEGKVLVKAPIFVDDDTVQKVVYKHREWIAKRLSSQEDNPAKGKELSRDEITEIKRAAENYFGNAVRKYSDIMGVKCGRIKITSARRRFGSCNSNGNICFSYRLMLSPEAAREYVVVHELAHLSEMNHSPRFYKIVEKYMPDYKQRKKLLD